MCAIVKPNKNIEYDTYIIRYPVVSMCFYAVLLFSFKVLLITMDFLLFAFTSIVWTNYIVTHIVFFTQFFLLIIN